MLAILFWSCLIGFLVGWLFRKRDPSGPHKLTCACPYCHKQTPFVITSITVQCPTCGNTDVRDRQGQDLPGVGS